MNLIFVSGDQYPDGSAASNRHIAYAKGLVELGHNVTFILYSRDQPVHSEFRLEGILFITAVSDHLKFLQSNKVRRALTLFYSYGKGLLKIKRLHEHKKIDAIVLLSTVNCELIPFIGLARTIDTKLLHERTEYPFVVIGNSLKDKLHLKYYLANIIRKFDGIYVINNALKRYFTKYVNPKASIEIINMIVDPMRFKRVQDMKLYSDKYIAYCGTLNNRKDGVGFLLQAFANAINSKKIDDDIKLMLIGDFEDATFQNELEDLIKSNNYSKNVVFTGKVNTYAIPGLLNNASALALARPDNKTAEGGFPTKLGEYLATGKPVIMTDVGEIGLFLKDGYNAFIAKPDDIESFTGKILEVFLDYKRALEIGKQGRVLTENEFNYLTQARKLAAFIESL